MLEDLLRYINNFTPRSDYLDGLQSRLQGWHEVGALLLVRMVAHLMVMLPHAQMQSDKRGCDIMPLQLHVIQALLSREKVFADAFIESGATFLFLKILSPCDFDMSDELRSIVLDSFLVVARYGRVYKEALCDSDLLAVLEESMDDTLDWNTIPKFCSLLCEVFRGNPRYQKQVLSLLETWLDSSAKRLCDVALRASVVALNTLIAEAPQNSHLTDKIWIYRIFAKLIALLDSNHRLSSDIVSLLCRFVKTIPHSARHLFDFCRDQMMSAQEMEAMSFRLEKEAYLMTDMETDTWVLPGTNAVGGRLSVQCTGREAEIDRISNVLVRWSLITFLCRNHQVFCEELVEEYGLTELFLLNLCDLANPLMQKTALEYLHILRLHCQSAELRMIDILGEPEIFDSLSVEELMKHTPPATMRQIRFNLRSWKLEPGVFPAAEFLLHTDIITTEIDELVSAPETEKPATLFLTETPETTRNPDERERHFRTPSHVPLPFHPLNEYKLRLPPIDEMDYCHKLPILPDPAELATLNFLASHLKPAVPNFDPADTTPDLWNEVEPLTYEIPLELSVQVGDTMESMMSTLASQYRKEKRSRKDKSWMEETTLSGQMESWEDPSMSLDEAWSTETSSMPFSHSICVTGEKVTEVLLPRKEDRNGPLARKVLCLVTPRDHCGCGPQGEPLAHYADRVVNGLKLKELPMIARSHAGTELLMSARSDAGTELLTSARSHAGTKLPTSARSYTGTKLHPVRARSYTCTTSEFPLSVRSRAQGMLPLSARSLAGTEPTMSARSQPETEPRLPSKTREASAIPPSRARIIPEYSAFQRIPNQSDARPVNAQPPSLVPAQPPGRKTLPPKFVSRHRIFLDPAKRRERGSPNKRRISG